MNKRRVVTVRLDAEERGFPASMLLEDFLSSGPEAEELLSQVTSVYTEALRNMRSVLTRIAKLRAQRRRIPARTIWQLGDMVFRLKHDLERRGAEIDGLYDHIVRDLGVKRKWIEKVVTFRRYVPDIALVPTSLPWGQCEKGTRKVAQRLAGRQHIEGRDRDGR